ncbi:MAG: SIMPL domain-containing protein [Patescibacteria group bacterium]
MGSNSPFFGKLAMTVWVTLLMFLGIFLFPWKAINWGTLKLATDRTITVTGTSEQQTKNQIAMFSAGVTSVKDKKEDAVSEVNTKMEEIVTALKNFGIATPDIKTQNASIYQTQETYYEDGRQKSRPGQWSVSNNIEIILRDVDKASALSDLLAKSGANNVYGPTFSLDQTTGFEEKLATAAIEDARKKAAAMAVSSGASLGEVINVVEGYNAPIYPVYALGGRGGGGGAAVEPGSSTVAKTVTVTFRLE